MAVQFEFAPQINSRLLQNSRGSGVQATCSNTGGAIFEVELGVGVSVGVSDGVWVSVGVIDGVSVSVGVSDGVSDAVRDGVSVDEGVSNGV